MRGATTRKAWAQGIGLLQVLAAIGVAPLLAARKRFDRETLAIPVTELGARAHESRELARTGDLPDVFVGADVDPRRARARGRGSRARRAQAANRTGPMRCAHVLILALAAAAARAETAYVSDEQANVVHVVASDGTVAGAIAVGKRPRGLALSHDAKRLYVACGNDNRIDVVDLASRAVVDSIPSGPDPERFALSPDERTLYVANENDSTVSFVDLKAKKIVHEVAVGAEPEGIAASPDGRWVVCTSESVSVVHFIDAKTAKLVDSVLVGTRPRDAQFDRDGRRLWVSSETRAPETVQAVGIALAPGGDRAFVALGRGNGVAEVDARSLQVLRYLPAGSRVWGVAIGAHGTVYAAAGLSGDLTIVARDGAARTVALGGRPWGVVVAP